MKLYMHEGTSVSGRKGNATRLWRKRSNKFKLLLMDAKKEFFDIVKKEFAPALRDVGFKGSGQNFRRVQDEVINVVNIQGNKYGGSCAVNLGLHLTFLPLNWTDQLPDIKRIKAYDCEFRMRLAPRYRNDYWWKFGSWLHTPTKKARHLINVYFQYGEPRFKRFNTVEKIVSMLSIDDIKTKCITNPFGTVAVQRGALTMARIYQHRGKVSRAKEFAKAGLDNIGRTETLRPALEEIINSA